MLVTRENKSTQNKTCPTLNLSTTKPEVSGLGLNPVLRGERWATKCRSYYYYFIIIIIIIIITINSM